MVSQLQTPPPQPQQQQQKGGGLMGLGTAIAQARELADLAGAAAGGQDSAGTRSSAALQAEEARSLGSQTPVQRSGSGAVSVARSGFGGKAGPLPYRTQLERTFGVDLSDIPAYTGSAAESAAHSLGARAYAHEGAVVLGKGGTDFRTVAEETSHALQMRNGSRGPGAGQVAQAAPQEQEARHSANEAVAGHSVGTLSGSLAPDAVALSAGGVNAAAVADKKLRPFWDSAFRGILEAGLCALVSTVVGAALGVGLLGAIGVGAIVGAVISGGFKYVELETGTDEASLKDVAKAAAIGAFAGALGGGAGTAIGHLVGGHGVAYYAAKWSGKTVTEAITEKIAHAISHGEGHGHTDQADAIAKFTGQLTTDAPAAATTTVGGAASDLEARAQEAQEMIERYGAAYGYDAAAAGSGESGAVPRFG